MADTNPKTRRSFQASSILFAAVCLIIALLVLVPIGYMVFEGVTDESGAFTLQNFIKY